MPKLEATYQLENGTTVVKSVVEIKSANKINLWSKGQTIGGYPVMRGWRPGWEDIRAHAWINLDPFTVRAEGTFQVYQKSNGRIAVKVEDLHSIGSDIIHIDLDTDNVLGFGGGADIKPWDREVMSIEISLGSIGVYSSDKPNPIHKLLRTVVGKEFEITH